MLLLAHHKRLDCCRLSGINGFGELHSDIDTFIFGVKVAKDQLPRAARLMMDENLDQCALLSELDYDVVIVGTGLPQAMLAAALSMVNLRVLHLDSSDTYGQEWSTLSLQGFHDLMQRDIDSDQGGRYQKRALDEVLDDSKVTVNCHSRCISWRYSQYEWNDYVELDEDTTREMNRCLIDLTPRLVYSASDVVDAIVRTNVSRYVEFHAINSTLCYQNGKVCKVPISKSDIFESTQIGRADKRRLMKFLHVAMQDRLNEAPSNSDVINKIDDFHDKPFQDLMESQSLPHDLQEAIMYALCLVRELKVMTTSDGVSRLKRFMYSVGRYAPGALLHPLYGTGELAQAFCRLSAVYGGVYMLRCAPVRIRIDRAGRVHELDLPSRQCVTAKHFVWANDLVLESCDESRSSSKSSMASSARLQRCICITRGGPLLACDNEDRMCSIVVPPNDFVEEPVFAFQVDSRSMLCPPGFFITQFSSKTSLNASPREQLEQVVYRLAESNDNTSVVKCFFFTESVANSICESPFVNVHQVQDPKLDIDVDSCYLEAKRIFEAITSVEDDVITKAFLPQRQDDGTVIVNEEEMPAIDRDVVFNPAFDDLAESA